MKYASIRKMDIQNGPGVRVSLFTQGCDIQCKGCFNYEIWDYDGGKEFTPEVQKHLLELCNKPHIAGLSILGGEPLSKENFPTLKNLCADFKRKFPHKTIWLWTGRILDFNHTPLIYLEMLNCVDVVVDGPWVQDLGDFSLKYRGSSNQRVIDMQKSFEQNEIILLKDIE